MQYFSQFGSTDAAQGRALGVIGQTVADQAALMGYIDIFFTWAVVAAALVPLILLLVRRIDIGGGEAAVGH